MRNPFRETPKPFLDCPRRDWQFDTFAWLLRHCGGYPKFQDTLLVLPVDEHFPDRGLAGHAGAAALFRRVRDHAGMADWPCIVEPQSSERAPPSSGRIRVIHYDPAHREPTVLVAHFARELARYLVEHIEETPPGGAQLYGPAIELAAVFMGFGVFMANSSIAGAGSELNEGELVHALAIFCLLGNTPAESVDSHLNPHLRKYLRLARGDLERHHRGFQQLRSVFAVCPIDSADRSHPSRVR
jgi:hypothetical protein